VIERSLDPFDETREQLSSATAFVRRAMRSWRTAVGVLVFGGAVCAAFLVMRRPTFRSETVILYSAGVRSDDDIGRPDMARSAMFRLKEILMSRASLDAVTKQFDLYREVRRTRGPVDAVEELKKNIEFRAPGGDTFSLAFTGSSPQEARAVTARLAEVVIGQDSDLRRKQAIMVSDFLETEKRATEDTLREAETALASFMAAHPRFALDATPLATGAAIRASVDESPLRLASPLAAAQPRSFVAPRRVTAADAERVSNTTSVDARDATLEEARAKAALAAARANLVDLAARFTVAHPDVRAAQAEVERATARLASVTVAATSVERSSWNAGGNLPPAPLATARGLSGVVTRSPQHAAAAATGTADVSTHLAGESRTPNNDVVALETEWVKLTRETTEARQHQDQVEAALFKAKGAADSEKGDGVEVTMIDPAFLPQTAVPPGRAMVVALFAAGSLLVAVLAAALRGLLNDRVYAERDVGSFAPVLVLVPRRTHGARY
jgi:uncharacterized protein involved in exopolysaccharide biosynthesis